MSTRRSTDEVRALLIGAARELFGAQGYDATTTRQIASRAGVSEPLLFNHYGSKRNLFDAAVMEPFADLIEQYKAAWRSERAESSSESLVHDFVSRLFGLARTNRPLLLSLALNRAAGSRTEGADLLDELAGSLQSLRELAPRMKDARLNHLDAPATTAAVAGMVFGVALLDDLLFPADMAPLEDSELIGEIATLTMHGIAHRE
jgi:AcrR family transcriptional regulator